MTSLLAPAPAARSCSVLFAPANQLELLKKLPRPRPDIAVLDMEDAVPDTPQAKQQAREVMAQAAVWLAAHHPAQRVYVRCNAASSPYVAADVAALPTSIAGVVLPKVERAAELLVLRSLLSARGLGHLEVMAGLETVAGVEYAAEILAGAASQGVTSAYFGAEDYTADLGGVRSAAGLEVLYPRSRVAMVCRLAGVAALDIVCTALRDDDAFVNDAQQGRALGYSGKLCIHPAQVALTHQVFSPSGAEVARARALIAAYAASTQTGQGVLSFEGQMVDAPLLRRAEAVVASAAQAPSVTP